MAANEADTESEAMKSTVCQFPTEPSNTETLTTSFEILSFTEICLLSMLKTGAKLPKNSFSATIVLQYQTFLINS